MNSPVWLSDGSGSRFGGSLLFSLLQEVRAAEAQGGQPQIDCIETCQTGAQKVAGLIEKREAWILQPHPSCHCLSCPEQELHVKMFALYGKARGFGFTMPSFRLLALIFLCFQQSRHYSLVRNAGSPGSSEKAAAKFTVVVGSFSGLSQLPLRLAEGSRLARLMTVEQC